MRSQRLPGDARQVYRLAEELNDTTEELNVTSEGARSESPLERLDRNTVELLNGLRVAGAGIQVLFAFLLVVPFNARFARLSSFERGLYLFALICIAISAVLLIAPSIHHRLLFRRGEKAYIVRIATRLMIAAAVFLGVGMTGIMLLVATVVAGLAGGIIVAAGMAALIIVVWFALPLWRRSMRR